MNSGELNKLEYNYVTNNSVTIITNTFHDSAIAIVFLVDVIYFAIQVMDASSSNIILSIELDTIIVEIAQLISYLDVQS